MNIVFIDPKCPRPYDEEMLSNEGMGGTESTVIRVAEGLAKVGFDVHVAQHNRKISRTSLSGVRYINSDQVEAVCGKETTVVFIQKAQNVRAIAKCAGGRLWIWLHNFVVDEVPIFYKDHVLHRLGIICVSRTHARHTTEHIRNSLASKFTLGIFPRIPVTYVYNPLNSGLPPPAPEIDNNKLVFFSSPYKGIEHVLSHFHRLYEKNNQLRLYVANPGYVVNFDPSQLMHPGIVVLGTLKQQELQEHVRHAVCVFYPQRKRPETFGLVFAEANAVGVPVLAHDFGAASEVLCESNPPFDCSIFDAVEETLTKWRSTGRPSVSARPEFGLDVVVNNWRSLLLNSEKYLIDNSFEAKTSLFYFGSVFTRPRSPV